MGLGGLTRDSIVGLNNLVHDDDDDGQGNYGGNSNEYEHQGHRRNLSLNNGSKSFGVTSGNAGHCGDFLFIDGQLQESQSQPAEQSVALTSLNDCGKETGRPQRQSSFQGQPDGFFLGVSARCSGSSQRHRCGVSISLRGLHGLLCGGLCAVQLRLRLRLRWLC